MYWFKCCRCTISSIFPVWSNITQQYCFCVKHITLCIWVCSFSPSSRFSFSLIRSISEFGARKHFIDHRTANALHLFIIIKSKFFGSLLFQTISQRREIPQGLLDGCSHLFICISLKWTLVLDKNLSTLSKS